MDQKRPELDFDEGGNEILVGVFCIYCVLMALVANIMQKMEERVIIQQCYSDKESANWSTRRKPATVPLNSPPSTPLLLSGDELYEYERFLSISATVSFTCK